VSLIDQGTLDDLRAINESTMLDEGEILNAVWTRVAGGNRQRVWTSGGSYLCRVDGGSRQPAEVQIASQITRIQSVYIEFPFGTPVKAADRIRVTARELGTVQTYEVRAVELTTYDVGTRAECQAVGTDDD
jgi:hypothetical protein